MSDAIIASVEKVAFSDPARPTPDEKAGFSLTEMLVVICIIGILVALVVPSLISRIPSSRLNSEAHKVGTFLRQARLKAASTQKPIRVAINCINHFADESESCTAKMETAIFSDGIMDDWGSIRDGFLEINEKIHLQARTAKDTWNPTNGSSLDANLIWMVFMPNGQLLSSFGPPINLSLWYDTLSEEKASWEITLNPASGRISISERM